MESFEAEMKQLQQKQCLETEQLDSILKKHFSESIVKFTRLPLVLMGIIMEYFNEIGGFFQIQVGNNIIDIIKHYQSSVDHHGISIPEDRSCYMVGIRRLILGTIEYAFEHCNDCKKILDKHHHCKIHHSNLKHIKKNYRDRIIIAFNGHPTGYSRFNKIHSTEVRTYDLRYCMYTALIFAYERVINSDPFNYLKPRNNQSVDIIAPYAVIPGMLQMDTPLPGSDRDNQREDIFIERVQSLLYTNIEPMTQEEFIEYSRFNFPMESHIRNKG